MTCLKIDIAEERRQNFLFSDYERQPEKKEKREIGSSFFKFK